MTSHANVVILGLLVEGPQHGYEIMRRIEQMNLRQWARIGDATIYSVLGRLERAGALSVSSQQRGMRPARNVFALTPQGRRRLREGVAELLGSAQSVYSDRVVGLAFSWALPAADANRALRETREAIQRAVTRLKKIRVNAAKTSPMSGVLLDFYINVLTAERNAVEAVRAAPAGASVIRPRSLAHRSDGRANGNVS
jgi:DNA-binding PadR family transcriptional regulator